MQARWPRRSCRCRRRRAATTASRQRTTPGTRSPTSEQQAWFADVATKARAADVQGARQAVRCWCSGRAIPTARSTTRATASAGWCRASTGRPRWPPSSNADDDLGQPAGGAEGAGPRRHDRRDPHRRPRLLDHLQGERDQLRGEAELQGRAAGQLPPGFLAIDLAHALGLQALRSRRQERACSAAGAIQRKRATALIGDDPDKPQSVVVGQWRLRPDLSAERRTRRWPPRSSRLLSRAGLRQRPVRRRRARPDPRHAAAVGDRAARAAR